jgi:hypothetical protein
MTLHRSPAKTVSSPFGGQAVLSQTNTQDPMGGGDLLSRAIAWSPQTYASAHWTFRPGDASKIKKDAHGKELLPMSGLAVSSLDDMLRATAKAQKNSSTRDIYFCLATMPTAEDKTDRAGSVYKKPIRKAENAVQLKAIWLDIDVKPNDPKAYKTKPEAKAALEAS